MAGRILINILFVLCLISSSLQVSHVNFDFIDFNIDFKDKVSSDSPVSQTNKNNLITYKEEKKVVKPLDLNIITENVEDLITPEEEKAPIIKEDEIDSFNNELLTENITVLQGKIDDLQIKLDESEQKVKSKDAIISQYQTSIDSLIKQLENLKSKLQ